MLREPLDRPRSRARRARALPRAVHLGQKRCRGSQKFRRPRGRRQGRLPQRAHERSDGKYFSSEEALFNKTVFEIFSDSFFIHKEFSSISFILIVKLITI